ncbi:peptide chain release factor 1 [Thermaerobacter subterraneus]|uniref:Peptide chain release factor 1 n=1 Tax=Thermaerobacter subterraneus DSM 13965 TaxID=867903 RepID=K6Q0N6_9FIRM|nr:peptide chain release factor 1 [Thermaerobacter subterraneus]EKP94673.1 peptide chain release factor 1 [Thermaerobacter subterraneus DSM 13965]
MAERSNSVHAHGAPGEGPAQGPEPGPLPELPGALREALAARLGRFDQLERELADPAVAADPRRWQPLAQERAELEPLVEAYRRWREAAADLEAARALLREAEEADERAYLAAEVERLEGERQALERALRGLLLPRDPRDQRDVIMEIRAGTGGEEAALFAGDLFRMYQRYAERQGWRTEIMAATESDLGGFKEIIFAVSGRGAFSRLKHESGVHRVQRVPVTEAGGRIHTSTATVAVLPEAEEVEVQIDPDDLEIDTFAASGPGGQHVNKTESAVRITHKPTGIVVTCQDERSQHKNRARAMKILRARLLDYYTRRQQEELSQQRRSQVGTGERSEKIRTYNFRENRVTDHRIGLTLYRLQEVMDGDLDELLDALAAHDEQVRLGEAVS